MDERERQRRIAERRRKRRRQAMIMRGITLGLLIVILVLVITLIKGVVFKKDGSKELGQGNKTQTEKNNGGDKGNTDETESETSAGVETVIAEADKLAAMYDYDAAIELLQGVEDYQTNAELQAKAASYAVTKASCVEYAPEDVAHIFYHSLLRDPSKTFDTSAHDQFSIDGMNQWMTTVDEFNKITQSMYEKGYVMVSLKDFATFDEEGNLVTNTIKMPEGKKPFVMSQDDLSYYHSYDGFGIASKLIVDENGEVKNEYIEDDGSVSVGDYDMVPLIDRFVEEHPDFSYKGHKGIIALTGYNGVFGYRTDIAYKTRENLQEDQQKWLDEHPDFDWDADVAAATKVAEAMKADGWEFASHTWGHMDVQGGSLEHIKQDTENWNNYVKNIVGDTNVIIFAHGLDIGDWTGYENNEKFDYMKSQGFDIYCNVDGTTLNWMQRGATYLRMGRMNVDGLRMYYNPEVLEPLFHVSDVFDPARPTPVPGV